MVDRNQFETGDEYIEALLQKKVMELDRRELQYIGNHYVETGADEEDFDKIRIGIRYYDLAMNVLGSQAVGAKTLAAAIAQTIEDQERLDKIDGILEQVQKRNEKKAQVMSERLSEHFREAEDDEES